MANESKYYIVMAKDEDFKMSIDPYEPLQLQTERAWLCLQCQQAWWDRVTHCTKCLCHVERVYAFLCPVDSDNCDALVNEQQVKTHLVEDHAGEYPALWINSSGDLVVDDED